MDERKRMDERGLYFSLEALLGFAVLVLVLLSTKPAEAPDLKPLYLLQKQHDLLVVWVGQGIPSLPEMESDFRRVFPGFSGRIGFNDEFVAVGEPASNAFTESIYYAAPSGALGRLSITLYD
ncbi:MAG TPA: hypothetical protein HA252_07115 [Candidatus Diapherotrites archaeon]|uniref:Uncharacterized protein n=1 Tax=Candidatus Iainarchaeum sp. TaxID=3101447 RepID=A0A7J4JPL2_9ARCH|nr:hypothetical protein [Candidatus Diapherotrites archaeon]HIH17146.1 hypothetical protein [Candidatus Diapherotrites archaeon]